MLKGNKNFVPVMNSMAGLCLTSDNWSEINTTAGSFYLDTLLVKPGYTSLKKIPDIRAYLGWSGHLIVNAMNLKANKEGIYTITSPYDGSKIKINHSELLDIIAHIKPGAVILPKKFIQNNTEVWSNWPEAITPFIHEEDLHYLNIQKPHGVYFKFNKESTSAQLQAQVKQWSHLSCYITGAISVESMHCLWNVGVHYIESDEPAHAAMQGIVYSRAGDLDLTSPEYAHDFELLDSECTCPTCAQQFTKAYLHHLLLHTPLLCQRFLIQHNCFNIAFTL